MDLTFSDTERLFLADLQRWLSEHPPGDAPPANKTADVFAWRRQWQRRLAADGWAGVQWPSEHGGRDATVVESAIYFEALAAHGAPLPANVLGILLAGPTILKWGSDEQKRRYLSPILTAEEIWCQGFSEPDAGSDLAAVRTRAVQADDGSWRIHGQKTWTSYAQYATWCMLLARTDPDVSKHRGLTYFIVNMEQEGVEVRPLRQITGEAQFNEVFFDDVHVSEAQVLGGVGNGWPVALTTLMNERSGLAFFHQMTLRRLLDRLVDEAIQHDRLRDWRLRQRVSEIAGELDALRLTALRGLTSLEKHREAGSEGSVTKLMWARAGQQLTQLAVDVVGLRALEADSMWGYELLRARANTIEGGTTEILKDIVANRVLGLPRNR